MGSHHPHLRIATAPARLLSFPMADDTRGNSSNHTLEPGPPAMPRLPSCCPQHSPCSVSSQNQHILVPPHASCFQQHGHHFQHHHHHHSPHTGVPLSPPFSDSSCPVDRPPLVPAPGGPSSSTGTAFHDQASWDSSPSAGQLWPGVSFGRSGPSLSMQPSLKRGKEPCARRIPGAELSPAPFLGFLFQSSWNGPVC